MGAASALVLDGESLTLGGLAAVARDPRRRLELAPEAWQRIERSSALVARVAGDYRAAVSAPAAGETGEPPVQDYGITTGFGEFKRIPIAPADLGRLQRNLLISHTAGTGLNTDAGDAANVYPVEVVRAVLVLRLNTFAKGFSGIRPRVVEALLAMLHRGIVPRVPIHGSVGSSGDLCPLAHLFVVLVGEGEYDLVREPGELLARRRPPRDARRHLEADLGLAPLELVEKEGLALINGATFSAALLALAAHDAAAAAAVADIAAALSLEAACGCARAFDPKLHRARGQLGQQASAAHLRSLLAGSRLLETSGDVQDAYSLRAAPTVHGASRDAIEYVQAITEREANAATDNPLFFPGEGGAAHLEEPWDAAFRANWPAGYDGTARASYSAANFHGQPVALAADFLAIALAELASISERRTQLLLDAHHNRGLPANLVADGGVQSGLMMVQYCAAGLVSENKVLAHPASVDSIPTAANVEDHNSMATIAARKVRTVLANVQAVLAIELLAAAQAVDWRAGVGRAPGAPASRQGGAEERRQLAAAAARTEATAARLGRGTAAAYRAVRAASPTVVEDRRLEPEILAVRRLVASGELAQTVAAALT